LFAWPQNPITSNLSVRTENTNKNKLKIKRITQRTENIYIMSYTMFVQIITAFTFTSYMKKSNS